MGYMAITVLSFVSCGGKQQAAEIIVLQRSFPALGMKAVMKA